MASNGLQNTAKAGTCRMCQRVRNTEKYLKAVGEVHHGFAVGHIWECKDVSDCDAAIHLKLGNSSERLKARIELSIKYGRLKEYIIVS